MIRIFETSSGVFSYHLREAEEPKFGGTFGTTLCGKEILGWDTKLHLETWGLKTHLNEKYCTECTEARASKES